MHFCGWKQLFIMLTSLKINVFLWIVSFVLIFSQNEIVHYLFVFVTKTDYKNVIVFVDLQTVIVSLHSILILILTSYEYTNSYKISQNLAAIFPKTAKKLQLLILCISKVE